MSNDLKKITEYYKSITGISSKLAERLAILTVENPNIVENLENIVELSNNLIKDELTGLIIPKDTVANENKDKDVLLILETNKDVFMRFVNLSRRRSTGL